MNFAASSSAVFSWLLRSVTFLYTASTSSRFVLDEKPSTVAVRYPSWLLKLSCSSRCSFSYASWSSTSASSVRTIWRSILVFHDSVAHFTLKSSSLSAHW